MVAVMGYADRRSVRVGEPIRFKVSVDGSPVYKATVVRLLSPQSFPQPHAPEFRFDAMPCPFNGEHRGQHHPIPADPAGRPYLHSSQVLGRIRLGWRLMVALVRRSGASITRQPSRIHPETASFRLDILP